MDFWNDGDFTDGCIAGGRSYLHINAAGDVEPCAFVHYSNVNIHDVTLLMVKESGAKSTDMESPEVIDDLCAKTAPAAKAWSNVADRLWEENPKSKKDVCKSAYA